MTDCRKTPGCGQDHPGCIAHNRAGDPCGAQPIRHVDPPRCRSHLGRSVAVVRAEQGRSEEARRIFAQYGIREADDPLKALQAQVQKMLDLQTVIEGQVGELKEIRYRGGNGENIRGELVLLERAQDRCTRGLADLVRLDPGGRLQKVSERHQDQIVAAVTAAIGELGERLGFDAVDVDVRATIGKHLREIDA